MVRGGGVSVFCFFFVFVVLGGVSCLFRFYCLEFCFVVFFFVVWIFVFSVWLCEGGWECIVSGVRLFWCCFLGFVGFF